MRKLLNNQVNAGWLVLALVLSAALGIVGWLVYVEAPPANSVLIADEPTYAALSTVRPSTEAHLRAAASPLATTGAISVNVAEREPPAPTASALIQSLVSAPDPTQTPSATSSPTIEATPTIEPISVYVTGAVAKPGVYYLPPGARVSDAVSAAGGASADSALESVNLAARAEDEQHIIIPRKGDTPVPSPAITKGRTLATRTPHPSPTRVPTKTRIATPTHREAATALPPAAGQPSPSGPSLSSKININTAGAAELEALPGIGPALAGRIIDYRTQHGPFAAIEDLKLVPGIKEGLFARVRDYVTVGP